MQMLIPIANDDVCFLAVKGYVEKLQEAGLPVQLCKAATDAECAGETTVCVAWGDEDNQGAEEEFDEDYAMSESGNSNALGVAPAAAELYSRTLRYLGANPRAARNWLFGGGAASQQKESNLLVQKTCNSMVIR